LNPIRSCLLKLGSIVISCWWGIFGALNTCLVGFWNKRPSSLWIKPMWKTTFETLICRNLASLHRRVLPKISIASILRHSKGKTSCQALGLYLQLMLDMLALWMTGLMDKLFLILNTFSGNENVSPARNVYRRNFRSVRDKASYLLIPGISQRAHNSKRFLIISFIIIADSSSHK
jgi:hypothetical protein